MTFEIRVDLGLVVGVLSALVLFGAAYNRVVAMAERRGWMEGFTSLAVAVGTLITLAGAAAISWVAALIVLACFVASGLPMMAGSIWRYIEAREAFSKEQKHADQTQGTG